MKKLYLIIAVLLAVTVIFFAYDKAFNNCFTSVTLTDGTKVFFPKLWHNLPSWVKNRLAEKNPSPSIAPYVEVKDPHDSTKFIRIPMVKDSAGCCGGVYWKAEIPLDTCGTIVTEIFNPHLFDHSGKKDSLFSPNVWYANGIKGVCWISDEPAKESKQYNGREHSVWATWKK